MAVSANLFVTDSLVGSTSVLNAFANISIATRPLAFVGNQSFVVKLRREAEGVVIATTPQITISENAALVSFVANTNTIAEGDSVEFTLTTTGAANNSVLFYSTLEVTPNVNTQDFFGSNTGSFTLVDNVGTIVLRANTDGSVIDETGETFKLQVRVGSVTGNVLVVSDNVTILDTSNTSVYFISHTSTQWSSSGNVTFEINTINVPSNTVLYYNTSGNVISTDFVEGNTGSVVVVNNVANLILTANTGLPEGEARVFTLQLFDAAIDGNVLFSSNTITITGPPPPPPDYIATPTATPAAFGDALEGGFYTGLIWNQVTQSATSTTIDTGSKTFTVIDNMTATPLFYYGQEVEVRSRANPDTARMIGTVTNASGTTLTVNVTSVDGSGTLSDWSVMAKYRVIVAPKSSGAAGATYKSTNSAAPAACGTLTEGLKATLAMVDAGSSTVYPAAHFCNNLSIGGYSDWYVPARDELELIYRNLKPNTNNNSTTGRPTNASPNYKNLGSLGDVANTHGLNNNSYPQGAAYTTIVPGQTSVVAFQTGGAEAMVDSSYYWSSTEHQSSTAWAMNPRDSGEQTWIYKFQGRLVRAVRRSII
jgi:hypothetical protein